MFLTISDRIVPDVTVSTSGAPSISVVYIEMHSSPYEETLSKMGLVLMEYLRWLMHCNSTIKSWTGFVFLKRSKRSVVYVKYTLLGMWRTCVSKLHI